ncbi:hypothetical protein [Streptomyces sp. NPDC002187]|uniref:hypothetical protein n=1 Tax=Streptomyces sp. NPDC002187 TaxID=3364637 RepID=UPI00369B818A
MAAASVARTSEEEVENAGMRITTRLLDGQLPHHEKLFALPEGAESTVVTDPAPLLYAVRRVAVVTEGDGPMQLSFTGTSVRLQAGYADDVASQVLPAALESADDMTVAFNPSYLVDALSSFDAQASASIVLRRESRPSGRVGMSILGPEARSAGVLCVVSGAGYVDRTDRRGWVG